MCIYIYVYYTPGKKKTNIRNPEIFNGWKMQFLQMFLEKLSDYQASMKFYISFQGSSVYECT